VHSTTIADKYLGQFKERYGDKYTYRPETIINSYTKIPIECPEHGLFYKSPYNHTRYGCRLCGVKTSTTKRIITQEEYIDRCTKLYGDKYDLSETIYTGHANKIKVICRIHGPFYISPIEFIRNHGCQKCGGNYSMSNEEYIEALGKVHGDKYDLSLVNFTGTRHRVIGICEKHGEFTLRADHFLSGGNCPQCARLATIEKTRSNTEEFKEKVKAVHGDKYNFDKSVYTGSQDEITVTCSKHGDFKSIPSRLLLGNGCYSCSSETANITKKKIKEESAETRFDSFVTRAIKIHGNKFKYHFKDFVDMKTKTRITCNKHGDFWQAPSSHIQDIGCPSCNESKGEKAVDEILGKLNLERIREYKIPEVKKQYNKEYEYDFCLPKYKVLIEFHGRQHYEPVDIFGGQDGYEILIKNDFAKETLAKVFQYKLIVIHHKLLEGGMLEKYLKRQLTRYGVLPFK